MKQSLEEISQRGIERLKPYIDELTETQLLIIQNVMMDSMIAFSAERLELFRQRTL